MDDLHDFYGCPEFNQYNTDCVQLARYYNIPCYSTAGVADAKVPGIQATFEKLFTHLYMAMSGAQYIHYAFGLMDRTSSFCPVQAVIDNEHIGKIKHCLRTPKVTSDETEDTLKMVRKVMFSGNRLYARHARKAIHAGDVSTPYLFETAKKKDMVVEYALARLKEIEKIPAKHLDQRTVKHLYQEAKGLLPRLKHYS
jgi:trimethylamine--corrinoid protein Co-methyltransferase